jgi:hypothetical protein
MKRIHLLVLSSALAMLPNAFAADPNSGSPFDTNPKCRERTTTADPDCVIQDGGTPRQTYPPAAAGGASKPPATNPSTPNAPIVNPSPGTPIINPPSVSPSPAAPAPTAPVGREGSAGARTGG